MVRTCLFMLMSLSVVQPVRAQDASPLANYFLGKQVVVKMDMPGTQKGVDLSFNKSPVMDWNEYSLRLKAFGVALPKGSAATVTKFVVKKDLIEFQLNGGGFGTAGDDSSTTVSASLLPKSQYEKDLEKQIAGTTDARKKRDLEADLDRERSRRERIDAKSRSDAATASQMKAQLVAGKRLQGGSRFNLRWKGAIPSDELSPDGVMQRLAEYVDFSGRPGTVPMPAPVADAGPLPGGPVGAGLPGAAAELKRGMRVDEVETLLGRGSLVSQNTSVDGLRTRVYAYRTQDSAVQVTFVEGVVVKYSIQSN